MWATTGGPESWEMTWAHKYATIPCWPSTPWNLYICSGETERSDPEWCQEASGPKLNHSKRCPISEALLVWEVAVSQEGALCRWQQKRNVICLCHNWQKWVFIKRVLISFERHVSSSNRTRGEKKFPKWNFAALYVISNCSFSKVLIEYKISKIQRCHVKHGEQSQYPIRTLNGI